MAVLPNTSTAQVGANDFAPGIEGITARSDKLTTLAAELEANIVDVGARGATRPGGVVAADASGGENRRHDDGRGDCAALVVLELGEDGSC